MKRSGGAPSLSASPLSLLSQWRCRPSSFHRWLHQYDGGPEAALAAARDGRSAALLGGAYGFSTYIRPYLERVTGVDPGGLSLVLPLYGIASFVGTPVAAPLIQWNLRLVLPAIAAAQAVLPALLLAFGQFGVAASVFTAGWGFFVGIAGVVWSTCVAPYVPRSS